MTGRKSRAVSYFVLIPVSFVNCVRTFWKASCSLPPQSDSTVTVPVPSSLPPSPPPHAAAEMARATREDERREVQRVPPDHLSSSIGRS